MDNQFVIRRADITDIEALSELRQKTFRETFEEDLSITFPKNDLDSFLRSSGSPEIFGKTIHDPQQAVWVIEDKTNGELVAFTVVGPCNIDDIPHPDVCSNKDAAIYSLFIRRDLQNREFGQQLMDILLPWLDEQYPERPIWLNVWPGNFKAQKFYAHYGFKKVGECDYLVGEWKDREFIMKRQTHT